MVIIDTCMHLSSHDTDTYPPCGDAIPYFRNGRPDPNSDASPEHLWRCMSAQEVPVERAFNFCNGWYGWDNRLAMDLLKGNEGWLACGVLLDPSSPSSPDELRRLVAEGACGLRIQPIVTGQPLDAPAATPLWAAAAELGIAVDVNLPQHEYDQVATRAAEFPTVPIIVDHCGWLVGSDPETLTVDIPCSLAVYPNVYVKITFCHVASREPYPHRDTHFLVHQLISAFGAERCLWGSNFVGADQQSSSYSYEDAFQLFYRHLGLSEEDRSWVMGGTAAKLFRWRQDTGIVPAPAAASALLARSARRAKL